jgi:quercetin dioxygenase-like cupin family protein
MDQPRLFHIDDFMQASDGEPIRSVVVATASAIVVAWLVLPGQTIAAHIHPEGQDTWTILSGAGDYQVDAAGTTRPVLAGDVVVARAGEVHGVHNSGTEPLRFVSVVCPLEAGYQLV